MERETLNRTADRGLKLQASESSGHYSALMCLTCRRSAVMSHELPTTESPSFQMTSGRRPPARRVLIMRLGRPHTAQRCHSAAAHRQPQCAGPRGFLSAGPPPPPPGGAGGSLSRSVVPPVPATGSTRAFSGAPASLAPADGRLPPAQRRSLVPSAFTTT